LASHSAFGNLGWEFTVFLLHHTIVLGLQSGSACMVMYCFNSGLG
jgi:hypothetical protein